MTIEKARQLLKMQASFGGFHNGSCLKLMLDELGREHGQVGKICSSASWGSIASSSSKRVPRSLDTTSAPA